MEIIGTPILDNRDLTQATPFERLVARIIDRILAVAIGFGVGISIAWLHETTGIIIGVIVGAIYLFFRDALPFLNGQSLGKQLLKIKVIDLNTGEGIDGKYGKAFLRELPTVIPLLSIIDALVIFSDRKRLGDNFADTIVVNVPRE